MRTVPGMTIIAVCDAEEMKRMMPQTLDLQGPIYIRLAKGGDQVVSREELGFKIGTPIKMTEGKDILIISTGITTQIALNSAELLKEKGLSTSVLHIHTIKPMDENFVRHELGLHSVAITIEEHIINGGLGSAIAEILAEMDAYRPRFKRIGLPNQFPHNYGSQNFLLSKYGITPENLMNEVRKLMRK